MVQLLVRLDDRHSGDVELLSASGVPATAKRRVAVWCAAIVTALLIAAIAVSKPVLSRIVRERMIRTLQDEFSSELEVKDLEVSVFPHFFISGEGLALYYHGRKDLPPLVAVRSFSVDADWSALLSQHLRQARLQGLVIQVPPKSERVHAQKPSASVKTSGSRIDEIICDGAVLMTLPQNPDKEPLVWEIRQLKLYGAGSSSPMPFRATLINAKPPGHIETGGKFGPWQTNEPRETPVNGWYTFENADLSAFRGISGILSSEGSYTGVLERIDVQGKTDTPKFALRVSGNPFHLTTGFHAIIDGTDGNTLLDPVNASLGRSSIIARGSVKGVKAGKGKTVSLNVQVPYGRLEDMLRLGVKGKPSMTGGVAFRARLIIPPGDIDIAEKMKLDGEFTATSAHFANIDTQEKINKLSHRGEGDPKAPPDETVASDFAGQFRLDRAIAAFQSLSFTVPGVRVALQGSYGLTDETIDFHGTAKLDAKLSQTTTGFKSFLLKAVDPFFKKDGAGASLPVKVVGTRDDPRFGLELRRGKRKNLPAVVDGTGTSIAAGRGYKVETQHK